GIEISVKPNASTVKGNAAIRVTVAYDPGDGSAQETWKDQWPITLPLAVSAAYSTEGMGYTAAPKAITVNLQHPALPAGSAYGDNAEADAKAKIADIRLAPQGANAVITDWEIKSYQIKKPKKLAVQAFTPGSTLGRAIGLEPSADGNSAALYVKSADELYEASKYGTAYVLNIGPKASAPGVAVKTAAVTLNISDKNVTAATATLGKEKIDIANPKSGATVMIKPANTMSEIAENGVKILMPNLVDESLDFMVELDKDGNQIIDGLSFRIVPKPNKGAPKQAYSIRFKVKLKNGHTVTTTTNTKVTPVQTKSKPVVNRKTATLYKTAPLKGETVGLDLKTPANVKLGEVRISEESVKKMKFDNTVGNNGFELIRSGEGEWTVYFKDGKAPQRPMNKKGMRPALGKSYKLQLELWAEGTYMTDADGEAIIVNGAFVPISVGKKKSAPTIVTITVNIK
ncbi:MAG: hypothetical protein FWG03_07040, partial [Clostridiales bacterium]|nr:hypothetical protein [Clostridiales bacterium]